MDKTVRMALLFDLYGELLTERQREYFALYYDENLTLSEIAENSGVSRQAVRDLVSKSEAALEDIERKTGLLARLEEIDAGLDAVGSCVGEINALNDGKLKSKELSGLCGKIAGLVERMKQ
ncbi:MAG: YlxM family DNA-binding protein [Oscillospiraceae bacterium]|nr:YlxM family DNA-binding protein [Oscillospiraceae bacterium]